MLLFFQTSAAAQAGERLERLRELYLKAVEHESDIERSFVEVEGLRAATNSSFPELAATATAYEGALTVLRAKHELWPPSRLRHLREGLRILDNVAAAYPANVEIRYLRLMSCYYLPSVFARKASVREDFAALVSLLPDSRGLFTTEHYRATVLFVLENGSPAPQDQQRLVDSLADVPG